MRAGKLPIQAISGTMGIMDGAAKVMKGLAAAGQAVVDEAVKAAESATPPSDAPTRRRPGEPDPDSRVVIPSAARRPSRPWPDPHCAQGDP